MNMYQLKMFRYLILALTVFLISCNPLEKTKFDENQFILEERSIEESSKELFKKLVHILKDAYQKGSDVFFKVLYDSDVQGILQHMDGLTRRVAESIIQKFKDLIGKNDDVTNKDHPVEKRNVKTSKIKLERLSLFLFEESLRGLRHFNDVVKDSNVQIMLHYLDSNDRRKATDLINKLRNNQLFQHQLVKTYEILKNSICVRVKNANSLLKPIQISNSILKRNANEISKMKLEELALFLFKESRKGFEKFREVIQSSIVKEILTSLDPNDRNTAKKLIRDLRNERLFEFKLVRIYETLLDSVCPKVTDLSSYKHSDKLTLKKRGFFETSTQKLERLTSILLEAYEKGHDYFVQIIKDSEVQGMINHLEPVDRQTAIALMNDLKRKLLENDHHSSQNHAEIEKRDFKENSVSLLKKLVRILKDAFNKGSDAFNEALENPDVKAILNSLNSLSRRIAEGIINNFKKLIKKIDEATNDDVSNLVQADWKEDSTDQLKKLVRILRQAFDKGSDYFNQAINDKDVKSILEHLGPLSRKIANKIIEGFKQVLEKIDNATKNA